MAEGRNWFRRLELDRTNWPETRDRILGFAADVEHPEPRRYPGYPRWPLPRVKARLFGSLDRTVESRRSRRELLPFGPDARTLARMLRFSHGTFGPAELGLGPVPSAGGLQCLELFLTWFDESWLPAGRYHYERPGHVLVQIAAGAVRADWERIVPALREISGGGLLWILVGDTQRVEKKYGELGVRFLLLEAGHLMQNLCLQSTSMGWSTVPLGGALDREIAAYFQLPDSDLLLYVGICGKPR